MTRDLTRLPKWAQRYVARLERDLELARERLGEGPADSNTFVYGQPQQPLGRGPAVRFVLAEREDGAPPPYVDCCVDEERLLLRGRDGLVIRPLNGNMAAVTT